MELHLLLSRCRCPCRERHLLQRKAHPRLKHRDTYTPAGRQKDDESGKEQTTFAENTRSIISRAQKAGSLSQKCTREGPGNKTVKETDTYGEENSQRLPRSCMQRL
jgi:hypothetical protein